MGRGGEEATEGFACSFRSCAGSGQATVAGACVSLRGGRPDRSIRHQGSCGHRLGEVDAESVPKEGTVYAIQGALPSHCHRHCLQAIEQNRFYGSPEKFDLELVSGARVKDWPQQMGSSPSLCPTVGNDGVRRDLSWLTQACTYIRARRNSAILKMQELLSGAKVPETS